MVKLYLICRDCKAIEHVGFGDYDAEYMLLWRKEGKI